MWTWKAGLGTQAPNLPVSAQQRWQRAAGAPGLGLSSTTRGGPRAAARPEDHQPVLLGTRTHGSAAEPALAGPQQHRAP